MMRGYPLISILTLLVVCTWLNGQKGVEQRPPQPPLTAEQRQQVTAARAILEPWLERDPVASKRALRIVYWTPADREPCADYEARLTRILDHIRDFYRIEMERNGFGPRTFPLQKLDNGLLKIYLVKGKKPFQDYGMKSGSEIREECVPVLRAAGLDPSNETLLLFCNMANWDPQAKTFSHNSPYYAGGTSRGGTAWHLDSPELDLPNLALKEPMIHDAQNGHISLGKHNSIFIGGIAHELGHALSLPHNREDQVFRDQGFRALMGDGNRAYANELRGEGPGVHLTLAHALRLAGQPLFSGSAKGLHENTRLDLRDLAVKPDGQSFIFSGRVESNIPVYGLVAYLDPHDGGDYDSHVETAVLDAAGRFSLTCDALVPGKVAQLRLVACHTNGATNQQSFSYQVTAEGKPEVTSLRTTFALAPIVEAINQCDQSAIQTAFDQLHAVMGPGPELNQATAIARRLVKAPFHQAEKQPAEIEAQIPTLPLTDTRPKLASVGYGRPAYDHLPQPSRLLSADGVIYQHGIYAHAPARHLYELGGKWKTLSGSCAIADGMRGSVVFILRGDGRELFRSPVLKAGPAHPFRISIEGVKELELLTEDSGDGNGSDWALWLEPQLGRE